MSGKTLRLTGSLVDVNILTLQNTKELEMIVYQSVDTVKTNEILFYSPEAVRKLGIMMLVNAAEANADMIMDMPEEYTSKPEMEAVFLHLNEQAMDMLEDHIHDLRLNLQKFLQNVKFRARVTRIDYKKDTGLLKDIHVELDVE